MGKSLHEPGGETADAEAVQRAGAFAIVLECIPADVARQVTAAVRIPTIGIGIGAGCDGQVLVINDLVQRTTGRLPHALGRRPTPRYNGSVRATLRGRCAWRETEQSLVAQRGERRS